MILEKIEKYNIWFFKILVISRFNSINRLINEQIQIVVVASTTNQEVANYLQMSLKFFTRFSFILEKLILTFFSLLMTSSLKVQIGSKNYNSMLDLTNICFVGTSLHNMVFFHVVFMCSFWINFQTYFEIWEIENNEILSQINLFHL